MRAPATWVSVLSSLLLLLVAPQPAESQQRSPWTTSRINGSPEPPTPYITAPAFPDLSFAEPLEAVVAPGGNRMYVAERFGRIVSFKNDRTAKTSEVFLDLGKVIYGFAFHPLFEKNGYVYVVYI